MDRTLLFGAAVLLFCVRDGRLLASRPGISIATIPILLVASAGCGLLAERISLDQATAWLADFRFWMPASLLHLLLSFHAVRRGRLGKQVDWVSLMPAPVWFVAVTGGAWMALARMDNVTGLMVGLVLGTAYSAGVGLIAVWGRSRSDPQAALRFGAMSHISAILLVPAATVLDRPLSGQPVDWLVTAVVLGSLAILLALSFAWHRYRRR